MVFCTGCDGCGCVELGRELCGSEHSCTPDDGHNDSRNMLDRSLIINIRLVASCWFLSLHPTFMMHGHKNLKLVNSFLVTSNNPETHVSNPANLAALCLLQAGRPGSIIVLG